MCLYCAQPLDGKVYRRGKPISLRLEWDHAIPRAFKEIDSPENVVACCQICNEIKSDLVFNTTNEARDHISKRREALGYSFASPVWAEAEEDPVPDDPGQYGLNCPRCGRRFASKVILEKHISTRPKACEEEAKRRQYRSKKKDLKTCPRCSGKFRDVEKHLASNTITCRKKSESRLTAEPGITGRTAEISGDRAERPTRKAPTLPGIRRTPLSPALGGAPPRAARAARRPYSRG